MNTVYFHIDVNSAFLSWSALKKLHMGSDMDLRLLPSIIGGDRERRHGVVLAKSLAAKSFGVKTGEPIVSALRKCPGLIIEPPDHPLYEEQSDRLFNFLSSFCPDLEKLSIDECFMDFTPVAGRYADPAAGANAIRQAVFEKFGFTVNIGISDKKILAKMASDFEKPNLVHTLFLSEIREKMWPLPVNELYMCGKASAEAFRKLEIRTIGDLAQADSAILVSHLKSHGKQLWDYANGIDPTVIVTEKQELKGIGNSTTLSQDAVTREEAFTALLHLSESVGSRLRSDHKLAGLLCTEIKYSTFRSVSHQMVLASPSASTGLLYQTACQLFDELWDGTPIRLLGIRTSKLEDEEAPQQLSLFDLPQGNLAQQKPALGRPIHDQMSHEKQKALDHAIDDIRSRFGNSSVVRGSLLHSRKNYKKH